MRLTRILVIIFSAMLMSCASSKDAKNTAIMASIDASETEIESPYQAAYLPDAVLYQTNGDYNDNVAVTLSNDKKFIMSYPAPSDVTSETAALPVGNGWLLDRRGGINEDTAFLTYTYEEYSQLDEAPSREELMKHIIPEARVVKRMKVPVKAYEAIKDPKILEKYVR